MEQCKDVILNQSDDYDGLPPDGYDYEREHAEFEKERQRVITHHIMVDMTAHEFAEAAKGHDVAVATSFAIASIQRHALSRTAVRLSVSDRDRLLTLAMEARGEILSVIQDRHGNARLPFAASAVDAVCALVVMWAEEEPWSNRPRELCSDVQKRARWLRNEMHNIAVEAQYQQKKSDCALQIVSDMRTQAMERRYG